MGVVRRTGWLGLIAGIATLAAGLGIAGVSALLAGDWWLAREPAIGDGLALIVAGLAIAAVAGTVLVIAEPIGWWRLLALPPMLLVAFGWAMLLFVGLAGHAGSDTDVATDLYSVPELLVAAVIVTLLIPLPIALARLMGPRTPITVG